MTSVEQFPSSPSIEQDNTPELHVQVKLGAEAIVRLRQLYQQEVNGELEA